MPNIYTDMVQLVADFKEDFPKFSPLFEDPLIAEAIGGTDTFFEPRVWGEYKKWSTYRKGWFNLVAHTLFISAIADQAVETGALPGSQRGLDSVNIADESQTFGTQMFLKMEPWDDELASSIYGVRYMRLRDTVEKGLIGYAGYI